METREPSNFARYQRQMLLRDLGAEAQRRLAAARVLIIGCGALGSVSAEQLARAGVGTIRIADRDIVEMTNLQRQVLFDERDALDAVPKAIAAARRLGQINSSIGIEPHVADVDAYNIERLATDVNLIIDGTDNVQTRYLINDLSVKHVIPWIYGACVGTDGRVLVIRPPLTACLRCIFAEPPSAAELPTCDTAGVLGPAAAVVGAMQAAEALKLLSGNEAAVGREMLVLDLWTNRFSRIDTGEAPNPGCPACGLRRFEFLESTSSQETTHLCGRNAVQIKPPRMQNGFSLDAVATRLGSIATVRKTEHLVRAELDGELALSVFADGRAIVHGTADVGRARSVYARYVGA